MRWLGPNLFMRRCVLDVVPIFGERHGVGGKELERLG